MLTDSQIKKIKPTIGKKAPDRYNDGNNLYLHVFESGGKRWIMDYRFEGKRKSFSIGLYPTFSLAEARVKRDEAQKLLRDGIEPNTVCALKLAVLVFVRPIELRSARWADIDFDAAEWKYTPPKTRNQTKLVHIVPLSRQCANT